MSKMLYFWKEFIRIMKQRNLIFGLIISMIFAVSCEEDDVCIGEGTPYLTVVFRNIQTQQNSVDTLFVEKLDQNLENPDTLYTWALTDSIKIPLGGLDESVSYFRIKKRASAIPDTLTVRYDTKTSYVSKACGFRITYENLTYEATYNNIQSLLPGESNVLENESATNLYIYYNY